MKLMVNNREREFSSQLNLQEIVGQLKLPSEKGIALAVNSEVIHRSGWNSYIPSEGDDIILMQAVQGG